MPCLASVMTDYLWQELASISVEPPTGVNPSGATARRETQSKGLMTVRLHFVSLLSPNVVYWILFLSL